MADTAVCAAATRRTMGASLRFRGLLCVALLSVFGTKEVVAQPNAAQSTLVCASTGNGAGAGWTNTEKIKYVRVSGAVSCVVSFKDNGGVATAGQTTTAVASCDDVGGTGDPCAIVSETLSGNTFFVTVAMTAPSTLLAIGDPKFNAKFSGVAIANSPQQMDMVGTPTTASTVACQGAAGAGKRIREAETVTCAITVKGAGGATTGLALDFAAFLHVGAAGTPSALADSANLATVTGTLTAPGAGATFQVTGKLQDASSFTQGALSMVVVGTPAKESTVVCAGDVSGLTKIRAEEIATCTITIRKADGSTTTGFPDDFTAPTLDKTSFQANSLKEPDGLESGNKAEFKIEKSVSVGSGAVGDTITVTPKLADGTAFTTPETLSIIGTPTKESTFTCKGDVTNDGTTWLVKENEAVTCTLTVRDASAATSGLTSDFEVATVGGTQLGILTDANVGGGTEGTVFTVTLKAPSNYLTGGTATTFTVTPKCVLCNPNAPETFTSGAITFKVVGRPGRESTLACTGTGGSTTQIRKGTAAACTVSVKNSDGVTFGIVDDFSAISTGGSGLSALAFAGAATSGDTLTFSVTAPATSGNTFRVTGRVKLSNVQKAFYASASSLQVVGQPSATKSTIECVGVTTPGAYVTTNEEALCTVTYKNAADAFITTGFLSDCAAPTVTGGALVGGSKASANGFTQVTFKVGMTSTTDPGIGGTFTVEQKIDGDTTNLVGGAAVTIVVIGTPTNTDSTLVCTGAADDKTTQVRTGEVVTCVITCKSAVGGAGTPTTCLASQFLDPGSTAVATEPASSTISGFTLADVAANGGVPKHTTLTFTVVAPNAVTTALNIKAKTADSAALTTVSPTVFGIPDVTSALVCVGQTSTITDVRVGEVVDCTITLKAVTVATTGDIADFHADQVTVGGTAQSKPLVSTSSNTKATFTFTAPTTAGATFTIQGRLVGGALFSEGPKNLIVIGQPDPKSTTVCAGAVTGTQKARINELAACTITINDAIKPLSALKLRAK